MLTFLLLSLWLVLTWFNDPWLAPCPYTHDDLSPDADVAAKPPPDAERSIECEYGQGDAQEQLFTTAGHQGDVLCGEHDVLTCAKSKEMELRTLPGDTPELSSSGSTGWSPSSSQATTPGLNSVDLPALPMASVRPEASRRPSMTRSPRKARSGSVSLRKVIIANSDRYSSSSASDLDEATTYLPVLSKSTVRLSRSKASCLRRDLNISISSRTSSPPKTPPIPFPLSVEEELTRRLPPLPRFNPYMRMRSESTSVIESKERKHSGSGSLPMQLLPGQRTRRHSAPTALTGRLDASKRFVFGLGV